MNDCARRFLVVIPGHYRYGIGSKAGGSFLLQVFDIGSSNGVLSLNLTASRVGGIRGEVEPADLDVVP